MTLPTCVDLLFPGLAFLHLYRHLLDDFNVEPFERRHFFRPVREQTDPPQIQIGEDLGPDSNLALHMFFGVVQRGQGATSVKAESSALADLFNGKSLRSLMQINQRSKTFLRDAPKGAFEGSVAFASGRAKDVAHETVGVHPD